jgi:hypothetical protein
MGGMAASCYSTHDPHLREASWLDLPRDRENIAPVGPPIWRWNVPLTGARVEIDAYLGSFDEERATRDALLVMEYPDRHIVAVADGVTPTDTTPAIDDTDGARHAAHVVLDHVRAAPPSADLTRVLLTANGSLFERFGPIARRDLRPRDRPQAAAIVLALRLSDACVVRIDSARAADCEIWVRRGVSWSLQSPRVMLKDGPRTLLAQWDAEHPHATYQERIAEEMSILGDRSQWNLTALGRFERPKIDSPSISDSFDELVLVTDGANVARFASGPMSEPRDWMAELRRAEAGARPPARRHSDVAMLHVRALRPRSDR